MVAHGKTLAVVAFSLVLGAVSPAMAASCPDAQCAYVKMLLHRNQLAIHHQFNYLNMRNEVVARGEALEQITPQSVQQASAINRQLQSINSLLAKYNALLGAAKLKLIGFMSQTYAAIEKLEKLAPKGSAAEACYNSALLNFSEQFRQAQDLINTSPATPFAPSSFSSG